MLRTCATALVILVGLTAAARAEPGIGVIAQRDYAGAMGQRAAGGTRELMFGGKVHVGDIVHTGAGGSTAVQFLDDTRLQLGADTVVALEAFALDPEGDSGSLSLTLARGIVRYISGALPGQAVRIRTPSGTMTGRGARFIAFVDDSKATAAYVINGLLTVEGCDGSRYAVGGRQTARVLGDCTGSALSPGRGVPADPAVEEDVPALASLLPKPESIRGPQGQTRRRHGGGGMTNGHANGNGTINCLLPNTEVLLAEGGARRIDALAPGDMVRAYDAATGRSVATRVTLVVGHHLRHAHYVINGALGITGDHPVARAVGGGFVWTPAEELRLGDHILSGAGMVEVRQIAHAAGPVDTVYVETAAGSFIVAAGGGTYVVSGRYGGVTETFDQTAWADRVRGVPGSATAP